MTYMSETGRGKVKKEALLNDSDNLWAEFRHAHIGKVLTDLGESVESKHLGPASFADQPLVLSR